MNILLLNDSYEIENSIRAVEKLFERINCILEENKYVFEFMVIDGEPVYEDHYDYFIERMDSIREVKVVLTTLEEHMKNVLLSAEQYIEGALPEIKELSDEFYKGPGHGTWVKLQQFIEGMEWINSVTDGLISNKGAIEGLDEYFEAADGLREKLGELAEAVEKSDMVLAGDLFSYELVPVLEKLKDTAHQIVNRGVDRDGLN